MRQCARSRGVKSFTSLEIGFRGRLSKLAVGLAACVLALGVACMRPGVERPSAPIPGVWQPGLPQTQAGRPQATIAVIGETQPGPGISAVAKALRGQLATARTRDSATAVLWLGNHHDVSRHCRETANRWRDPAYAELAALARHELEMGSANFTLAGHDDWRCGQSEAIKSTTPSNARPWHYPQFHYVVRLYTDGRVEFALDCSGNEGCTLAPAQPGAVVEFVFADLSSRWSTIDEQPDDSPQVAAQRSCAAQLDDLLSALEGRVHSETSRRVPRILVSHLPIESAADQGLGTRDAMATFANLPSRLRDLARAGAFQGSISGHELSHQGSVDIDHGVIRSARTWLHAPLFQLVAGRASAAAPARALRQESRISRTSVAIIPDYHALSPGFSLLHIGADSIDLVTAILRPEGWFHTRLEVPTRPLPHPNPRDVPPLTSCLFCDPVDGAASGAR